jgi:hypothetical protein
MSLAIARHEISAGPDRIDADAFSAASRRRLSGPALRTFLAIADLWGLTEAQRLLLLGLPSRSTYHAWARAAREHREVSLDLDVLMRLSAVLGIHQALQVLHEREAEGIAWLKGAHRAPVFGGQSPLAVMTGGSQDAILTVRRFLDAARGGLFAEPNAVDDGFVPYTDRDIRFT